MKKSIFFFGALFIISSASLAQNADSTRLRGRLKQMSPSQRQELRKELRSKWDSLSPEQKEKVKTAYKQFFEKIDALRGKGKIVAPPPPPPPPPGEKEAIDKLSKVRDEQIRQALSAAQYKKYQEIENTLRPPAPPKRMPPPMNK